MPLSHLVFLLSSCREGGNGPQIPIWSESVDLRVAQQRKRVFITQEGHDLVLLTQPSGSPDGKLVPVKLPLDNDLVPEIRVKVTAPQDVRQGDRFLYEYSVANGAGAHQDIFFVDLAVPASVPGTEADYKARAGEAAWPGGVSSVLTSRQLELDDSVGKAISWSAPDPVEPLYLPLKPGQIREGFVVRSPTMPGFTTIAVSTLHEGPPDELRDQEALLKEAESLRADDHALVTTLTFGPMFPTGAPLHEVLANYRLGVERLSHCSGIPHSAAFLSEIAQLLREPAIESRLAVRLAKMKTNPGSPIERELMDCLRLVARAFAGYPPNRARIRTVRSNSSRTSRIFNRRSASAWFSRRKSSTTLSDAGEC
jgi:hypothetical protein